MTNAPNDSALRRNLSRMLIDYAADQSQIQRAAHIKRGRRPHTFRYAPSSFHSQAVRVLGRGDSADVARMIHADELASYLGVARMNVSIVRERKGVAYFRNYVDARTHRDTYAPDGRIVAYQLGYAVQVRMSGPYLDAKGIAR